MQIHTFHMDAFEYKHALATIEMYTYNIMCNISILKATATKPKYSQRTGNSTFSVTEKRRICRHFRGIDVSNTCSPATCQTHPRETNIKLIDKQAQKSNLP